ncbi:MAG: hypothetical protein AAF687_09600 [Pseudomonadota bacterium]
MNDLHRFSRCWIKTVCVVDQFFIGREVRDFGLRRGDRGLLGNDRRIVGGRFLLAAFAQRGIERSGKERENRRATYNDAREAKRHVAVFE